MAALGFKDRVDSFFRFLTCVIRRFTSSATPTDRIEVITAAEPFWTTSIGGGLWFEPKATFIVIVLYYTSRTELVLLAKNPFSTRQQKRSSNKEFPVMSEILWRYGFQSNTSY